MQNETGHPLFKLYQDLNWQQQSLKPQVRTFGAWEAVTTQALPFLSLAAWVCGLGQDHWTPQPSSGGRTSRKGLESLQSYPHPKLGSSQEPHARTCRPLYKVPSQLLHLSRGEFVPTDQRPASLCSSCFQPGWWDTVGEAVRWWDTHWVAKMALLAGPVAWVALVSPGVQGGWGAMS